MSPWIPLPEKENAARYYLVIEPGSQVADRARKMAGGEPLCSNGLEPLPAGVCSGLCHFGDAHECSLDPVLAGGDRWDLPAGALRGINAIADIHRLPRGEGSADLLVDDRVPADEHRDASRVLPGGKARMVRFSSVPGTTVRA